MEPLTKKQGMMKKLFVICSWALLLGGCKSESGASDPDGDKPVPPPSAELLQKIEDLNAGLVSLKTLAGAVSQSEVRSLAETEDGVRLTFCDGTEVTVACNAAAEAPLIGIAVDGDAYYWTLAAEKDIPWLKDAAGAKMPVSGPVPVVGRDDKGFWTVTTDAAVTPWQIGDGSGNPVEATGDEQVELFRSVKAGNGRVEIALTDGGTLSAAQVNDLSVAGTANCYVVSAPGTYVFNARVRGNGAGEGVGFEPAIEMADGMTADWLWTDSEGLVSGVALDTTSGDIFLTVGRQGQRAGRPDAGRKGRLELACLGDRRSADDDLRERDGLHGPQPGRRRYDRRRYGRLRHVLPVGAQGPVLRGRENGNFGQCVPRSKERHGGESRLSGAGLGFQQECDDDRRGCRQSHDVLQR